MTATHFIAVGVAVFFIAIIAGWMIEYNMRYGVWMFRYQKLTHYWRKPWR